MRSRRTQQQLLPHTHFHRRISRARTRAPPVRACKWKWMSVTPQGGQRSAEMHSGTSLRRLRSRCVAPASRRSPRACLCWGNTILSFRLSAASEGGRVTFPVPLCLSIPAGSFCRRAVSTVGGPNRKHKMRFKGESLQILSFVKMAFTSDLSEERVCFISDLNHLNVNHNSSILSLTPSFQLIRRLVSSDRIILLSRFSGKACPLFQRL